MKTVANFTPYIGEHCESTMIGNLLQHIGVQLSEPMLFGLGEGLSYIIWNMKIMDFPFLGGRIREDELSQRLCRNLGVELSLQETASQKKAWQSLKDLIDYDIPVGLKVDCYYLDYFTNKFHFNGHYVALFGYDEEYGYVADTNQQGKNNKAKLSNIALARNQKGAMASKNLSFVVQKPIVQPYVKKAIPIAIRNNALEYLNPPIQNIGYKGIAKTAKEVLKWAKTEGNLRENFGLQAVMMEKAGTGGALFRRLYRDFLLESAKMTGNDTIQKGYELFAEIKELWSEVSNIFQKIGEGADLESVKTASDILLSISDKEKTAMEMLQNIG